MKFNLKDFNLFEKDELEILKEELEKHSLDKIVKKLMKTPFEESKEILQKYLFVRQKAFDFINELYKTYYGSHYLVLGGHALSENLYLSQKWGNYPIFSAALAYARINGNIGDDDKVDMDYYDRTLKEGLKAEKFEMNFLKKLTDKQLYDLLTTGTYREA